VVGLLIIKYERFIAESVSEKIKIGEYMAKLQAIAWSSRSFCVRGQHTDKRRKSARDNHVHICNFAKYSPISKKKFTDRLSNKDFLV